MLKIENHQKKLSVAILNKIIFLFLLPFAIGNKKRPFPGKVKKILIIRADHLGDVIMSTSIFREIKGKFPESHVSVLVGNWGKQVLEPNPYVDDIIVHSCPWWKKVRGERVNYVSWLLKELPETVKRLHKEAFDIGIDLRGDFRHILFFLFLPGVRSKISYDRSGGEYLLNKAVDYEIDEHEIEKNFKLMKNLDIAVSDQCRKRPQIFLKPSDVEGVNRILETHEVVDNKLKIVIHPSAGNSLRVWPASNFAEIINWLFLKYRPVVFLVGTEKEAGIGREIEKTTESQVINLIGKLKIGETAALIKKSHFFMGNDSSIAHLASSFEIPLLILYGPTDPHRCLPYSPHVNYIYNNISCSPCLQKKCLLTKTKNISACMEQISVPEVESKIEVLLKEFNLY